MATQPQALGGATSRWRALPTRGRARRKPPGIRTLAIASVLSLVVLAVLAVVPLMWSSSLLGRANQALVLEIDLTQIASELELTLDAHHQLGNLQRVAPDARLAAQVTEAVAEMRALLHRAPSYAKNDRERRAIAEVNRRVEVYLTKREQLDATRMSATQITMAITPYFDRARAALTEWRTTSTAELRRAVVRATRASRLSHTTVLLSGVFLVLAILGALAGVRRYVVSPIIEIHRVVSGLRAGDTDVRARQLGSLEMTELARALNELIEAAARQRNGELTFLAGVAHDLRNPLSAMKIGVHVLRDPAGEAQHGRTLAMLDRQVDRLARMVEDLYDATRMSTGRLELARERFDVRSAAQHVAQLYQLTSAKHELVLDLPREPVIVDADPTRIEQVLINLVSNAIEYAPEGGRVDFRVRASDGWATLEVVDRGIGIAPEQIDDLFMRFRRRAPDVAPGAALGLSVARRIVKTHGGSIEVESTLGVGSTFRVRLPRASSNAETRERTDARSST